MVVNYISIKLFIYIYFIYIYVLYIYIRFIYIYKRVGGVE